MSGSKLYMIKDEEPMLSLKAIALLMGTTEEVIAELPWINGNPQFPKHLEQAGKRITRETIALLGSDSMWDCIDYLATKENP
ncbi:hypothetical protein AL755_08570 [Arthrobacter sp. ERGS1:01]|uniref:hypothetical protein n=1 Tax=Arthrobacter sp. ERGS1:01 TaxID=1704044 RepID=UPI0006B3FE4E|nr:hypothetical protein [Arthrobacter sp. ERGS1:01]ALE05521.1 hypothetical protein AL755_08570 [Arthrobacter sp. ERGS1:01]